MNSLMIIGQPEICKRQLLATNETISKCGLNKTAKKVLCIRDLAHQLKNVDIHLIIVAADLRPL